MNGKIYMRRDRIQFEGLPFPNDGNSYCRQAAHAWECAAIGVIESAGYEADVNADLGNNHHKFQVWAEPTETNDDGDEIELSAAELTAAKLVAEKADEAGTAAAIKFAEEEAVNANPD